MALRVITGTVLKPDGSPWANATAKIRLVHGFVTPAPALYPPTFVKLKTDDNGNFPAGFSLEPNTYGYYELIFPNGKSWFRFTLPIGNTPIDLEQLYLAGPDFVNPGDPILTVIDERIAGYVEEGGLDDTIDQRLDELDIVSDKNYIHDQVAASDLWAILHNLNKKPSVTVVDSGDNTVIGSVSYLDYNSLSISFTAPFSGKAYLN